MEWSLRVLFLGCLSLGAAELPATCDLPPDVGTEAVVLTVGNSDEGMESPHRKDTDPERLLPLQKQRVVLLTPMKTGTAMTEQIFGKLRRNGLFDGFVTEVQDLSNVDWIQASTKFIFHIHNMNIISSKGFYNQLDARFPGPQDIEWIMTIRDPLERAMSNFYFGGGEGSAATKIEYLRNNSNRYTRYHTRNTTGLRYKFITTDDYSRAIVTLAREWGLQPADVFYLKQKNNHSEHGKFESKGNPKVHIPWEEEPPELRDFESEFKRLNSEDYDLVRDALKQVRERSHAFPTMEADLRSFKRHQEKGEWMVAKMWKNFTGGTEDLGSPNSAVIRDAVTLFISRRLRAATNDNRSALVTIPTSIEDDDAGQEVFRDVVQTICQKGWRGVRPLRKSILQMCD